MSNICKKMENIYTITGKMQGKNKSLFFQMKILLEKNLTVTYASNKTSDEIIKEFKDRCEIKVKVTQISSKIFDITICK
jgi:hypothetical protein